MNKDEIHRLQVLAGIKPFKGYQEYELGENISHIGTKRGEYQRKHKIEPGTDEWFRLWFAKPHLTGEKPYGK
jgi:hypothetical protein